MFYIAILILIPLHWAQLTKTVNTARFGLEFLILKLICFGAGALLLIYMMHLFVVESYARWGSHRACHPASVFSSHRTSCG